MKLGDLIKSADWKSEKHVPVIECSDQVEADKPFQVSVSVGKEIAHPNTTEHYIKWIDLYFKPEKGQIVYYVGRVDFAAHGESAQGANQGPVYAHPLASFSMQVNTAGTLQALAFCNIHGLWESSKEITV